MPNLFDIVMNSMQILQYELGNFKAITADVLINPDLSDFTWIEYYRADELIARGAGSRGAGAAGDREGDRGENRADPARGPARARDSGGLEQSFSSRESRRGTLSRCLP